MSRRDRARYWINQAAHLAEGWVPIISDVDEDAAASGDLYDCMIIYLGRAMAELNMREPVGPRYN